MSAIVIDDITSELIGMVTDTWNDGMKDEGYTAPVDPGANSDRRSSGAGAIGGNAHPEPGLALPLHRRRIADAGTTTAVTLNDTLYDAQ